MAKQVVEKALEEIRVNIALIDLGLILLNTLILFACILLFATIFDFSIYFALIPSIIYFIFVLFRSFKNSKYMPVENDVPELREQLRTVADNVHRTNPIIESLKEDVVKNMSKVRTSNFLDLKVLTLRLVCLTLISLSVVIAASSNTKLNFVNAPFSGQDIAVRGAGQDLIDLNLSYKEGNASDIFGRDSIAKLGTKEMQLVINPLESDTDLNNIKKITKEDFDSPQYPKEIYTSYDVVYNEKIAKENQKVVKNYFEQITG